MFFKKKPTVTGGVYSRWVRAMRPPLQWFAGLNEDEQEELGAIGDDYMVEFGEFISNLLLGPLAPDENGQQALSAADLAKQVVERMPAMSPTGARVFSTDPITHGSMSGVTNRREELKRSRQRANDKGKSFLGKAPDPV